MTASSWTKGDSVVHSTKPEWGHGEVIVAETMMHEGKPAQRLTIRFARAGTKTISTAFAKLLPAASQPRLSELPTPPEPAPVPRGAQAANGRSDDHDPDPIAKAAISAEVASLMGTLPDAATDPFSSLKSRFRATLDLYRFTTTGGSLLDWASAQTGMKDPLARFNRHELEQWFQKFRIELDNHLRRVVREIKKQDPQGYAEVSAGASPAAARALRMVEAMR